MQVEARSGDWLRVGALLDVQDRSGYWSVAVIIESKPSSLFVHYDGYNSKWDETIRLPNPRIQPFRKHTLGFTGHGYMSRKSKYDPTHFNEMRKRLDSFIIEWRGLTPQHIVQFIRGQHFKHVEVVLIASYEDLQGFCNGFGYIYKFIEFYQLFLRFLKDHVGLLACSRTYEQFIQSPTSALVSSFYELSMNFVAVMGDNERLKQEYLKNLTYFTPEKNPSRMRKEFVNLQGPRALLQLLEALAEAVALPFQCVFQLLELVYCVFREEETDKGASIAALISAKVGLLQEVELKFLQKKKVQDFIALAYKTYSVLVPQHAANLAHELQIDICFKFLRQTSLQRRIRGISELRELVLALNTRQPYLRERCGARLMEKDVVSLLFGSEIHVELVKRSQEIMNLLCVLRRITPAMLESIIGASQLLQEDVAAAVFEVLIGMVSLLPSASVQLISSAVEQRSVLLGANCNLFQFLAEEEMKRSERLPFQAYRGLQGLLRVYRASRGEDKTALDSICELFERPSQYNIWSEVLESAVKQISEQKNSHANLRLFFKLVFKSEFYSDIATTLSDLNEQYNLVSTITKSLTHFVSGIAGADPALVLKELKARIDGLKDLYLNNYYCLQPSFEDIQQVWLALKGKGALAEDCLFQLLALSHEEREFSIPKWIELRLAERVYNQLLSLPQHLETMTQLYFEVFKLYHRRLFMTEIADGSLAKFRVARADPQIYQLLLTVQQEEVVEPVIAYIIEHFLAYPADLVPNIPAFLTSRAKKIVDLLKSEASPRIQARFLRLLLALMDRLQGLFQPKVGEARCPSSHLRINFKRSDIESLGVRHPQLQFMKQVVRLEKTIDGRQPVGVLRCFIAKLLNISYFQVKLVSKYEVFEQVDDHLPFSQSRIGNFIQVSREHCTSMYPGYAARCGLPHFHLEQILAQDQSFKDLLEGLLRSEVMQLANLLLKRLPINPLFKKELSECTKPWQDYFRGSVYNSLHILDSIAELASDSEWRKKFVKSGGTQELACQFTGLDLRLTCESTWTLLLSSSSLLLKFSQQLSEETRLGIAEHARMVMHRLVSLQIERGTSWEQKIGGLSLKVVQGLTALSLRLKASINWISFVSEVLALSSVNIKETVLGFCLEDVAQYPALTPFVQHVYKIFFDTVSRQITAKERFFCMSFLPNLLVRANGKLETRLALELAGACLKAIEKESRDSCLTALLLSFQSLARLLIQSGVSRQLFDPSNEKTLTFLVQLLCQFQPKLKSSRLALDSSRQALFKTLGILMQASERAEGTVVGLLKKHLSTGQWRGRRASDWKVQPPQQRSSGFVGLKNLGCTCYMNSFIQQLFHIKSFREGIIGCEPGKGDLLSELREVFLNLHLSCRQFVTPEKFCRTVLDVDGNPTDPLEQKDVDQFSNLFFDQLQKKLEGQKDSKLVAEHFSGAYLNQILCIDCPHRSEQEEPFLSVAVDIKGKGSLEKSLECMIRGEVMQGADSYFCEKCDKKVSAVKRLAFKSLPNFLILALKRIEFNYDSMTKIKINEAFSFPQTLDLQPYSQQGLEGQSAHPSSYFRYSLRGIVVHLGYADNGHYYSFIRVQTDKWFQFNDTNVLPFNPAELPFQAFGGQENSREAPETRERNRNAYLLFYQREQIPVKAEQASPPKLSASQPLVNSIAEDNRQQLLLRILFSSNYQNFIRSLLEEGRALELAIAYYFTVLIREKSKRHLIDFADVLLGEVKKSPHCLRYCLLLGSNPAFVQQVLRDCPLKEVRRACYYFFIEVLRSAYRLEEHLLLDQPSSSLAVNFANSLLANFKHGYNNQIFMLLLGFHRLGSAAADYLAQVEALPILLASTYDFQDLGINSLLDALQYRCQSFPVTQPVAAKRAQKKTDQGLLERTYLWALVVQSIERSRRTETSLTELTKRAFSRLGSVCYRVMAEQTSSKLHMNKFSKAMMYLAFQNKQLTEVLLDSFQRGLKDKQFKNFRPFFVMAKHLSLIQDSFSEERRRELIKRFMAGLRINFNYFMESDIVQKWLLKTVAKQPKLAQVLWEFGKDLQHCVEWIATKDSPQDQVITKNKQCADRLVHELHGIEIPCSARGYAQCSLRKKEQFRRLLEHRYLEPERVWDSDNDLAEEELEVNQMVSYFSVEERRFKELKVTRVTELQVRGVEPGSTAELVFARDDEALAEFRPREESVDLSQPTEDASEMGEDI